MKILALLFILLILPTQSFAVTELTRHSITWTFADDETCGTFANGDPWCVGPVSIIGFSPASVDNGSGRIINGSQINIDPDEGYQGFDSGCPVSAPYKADLNVALGVNVGNPLVLASGTSLVSTQSLTVPTSFVWLKSASVLTILSEAPPDGSFRPALAGTDKTIRHNESDINYSYLKNLTPTASAPSLATKAASMEKVWLDYRQGANGRPIHPSDNMPDYGRDMSSSHGEAALLLNCDYTNEQKRDLLVYYLQLGIDLMGVINAGTASGWPMDGGHGPGRKFPILFAGKILGDADMLGVGQREWNNPVFGEDHTTFYMTEAIAKAYLTNGEYPHTNTEWADPAAYYIEADWTYINPNGQTGIPEYGKWHLYPSYEGRWMSRTYGASYRTCCHVNEMTGWLLATHVMGLKNEWNHDALFDYADRYLAWALSVGETDYFRHSSDFAREMWETYRHSLGPVWPSRRFRARVSSE